MLQRIYKVAMLMFVSLMFHYTHDAGKPSHSSTKELHITEVSLTKVFLHMPYGADQ